MKKTTLFLLLVTHLVVGGAGFALGIYMLPILIAPPPPAQEEVAAMAEKALYSAEFVRDLQDSDALHWGEGTVAVGADAITFMGELAPGPDYKLYLSPQFVETEADFKRLKSAMVRVGDVKTFQNFVVPVPTGVDPSQFNAVIVWCETFQQFITAAAYR